MLGEFLTNLFEINHRIVESIQVHIIKRGKRNAVSRYFHERNDKKAIAAWKMDLDQIRRVLTVRTSLVSA